MIIRGDQLRGHMDAIVLSALSEGQTHGFELLKRLQVRSAGAFDLKEGTLYPVLYRLEAAGLVKAQWEKENSPRRGPRRRVYQLTSKGTRALQNARNDWQVFTEVLGRLITPSPLAPTPAN